MWVPAQVLEGLKHYFLLDRGDLLAAFLDTAEAELAKPAVDISVPRLQSLLELGTFLFSEISPLPHKPPPPPSGSPLWSDMRFKMPFSLLSLLLIVIHVNCMLSLRRWHSQLLHLLVAPSLPQQSAAAVLEENVLQANSEISWAMSVSACLLHPTVASILEQALS